MLHLTTDHDHHAHAPKHHRRIIPHDLYGYQPDFKPHIQHVMPNNKYNGPDWSSRLRYIPPPNNKDYPVAENWPEAWKSMRSFPGSNNQTYKEWMLYPIEGKDATLRTKWDGLHYASSYSSQMTDGIRFSSNRHESYINKRNGISMATPGDKSYQAPEYEPDFHKKGSTRPIPVFGANLKKKTDTFITLNDLHFAPEKSFVKKEKARKLQFEIDQVQNLENWRPATPLGEQTAKLAQIFQQHKPRGKWRHGQYHIYN